MSPREFIFTFAKDFSYTLYLGFPDKGKPYSFADGDDNDRRRPSVCGLVLVR